MPRRAERSTGNSMSIRWCRNRVGSGSCGMRRTLERSARAMPPARRSRSAPQAQLSRAAAVSGDLVFSSAPPGARGRRVDLHFCSTPRPDGAHCRRAPTKRRGLDSWRQRAAPRRRRPPRLLHRRSGETDRTDERHHDDRRRRSYGLDADGLDICVQRAGRGEGTGAYRVAPGCQALIANGLHRPAPCSCPPRCFRASVPPSGCPEDPAADGDRLQQRSKTLLRRR